MGDEIVGRWLLAAALLLADPIRAEAICCALVPSATYYVNQETGSDANPGTLASPFLTVGKLVSVLACGESGAVYGGSSVQLKYREQFTGATCATTRQTLVGYGRFQPLLDGSDVVGSVAFSKTSGRTSVYQADLIFEAGGFPRIWENGVSLARAVSLADLDATAGRYYVVSDPFVGVPSTVTVYVHATGDGDPGSNGKTYEYNRRTAGVFSASGMVVSNIATRRQLSNNGSFETGPFSFLTGITATDGTKHNLLIHRGTTIRYCTLTDSYYAGQGKIALVLNDNSPTSADNAWIESCDYTETLETGGVGFYGHTNVSGGYGTVTLKNCSTGVGVGSAISGFASDVMVVDGGTFATGTVSMGSASSLLRNITVNNRISAGYPISVELDGVTATCDCANGTVSVANGVALPALNIHDSAITNTRLFDGAIYIGSGATISTFTLLRNVFPAVVQTSHLEGPGTTTLPADATINGNTHHYSAAPTALFYRGVTYLVGNTTQWNAWKALGFDATGSRITP